MRPLVVNGIGAVTSVGLTAPQTCAAVRARLSGFREVLVTPPPADPILCAPVPAHRRLKSTPDAWFANLASRALVECCVGQQLNPSRTAILLALPDAYREHPAVTQSIGGLLRLVEQRLQRSFHGESAVIHDGHAGVFRAVAIAAELIEQGTVEACLVGGVDSLVNRSDVGRLQATGRLLDQSNPQGTIPGEGAAFLLVGSAESAKSLARLVSVGLDREVDTVASERNAIGVGLQNALQSAIRAAGLREEEVNFRVSTLNGERYNAWDSTLATMRFYRTRRERVPSWFPLFSTGDLGAAAGALTLIVAANAITRGFSPGPIGMCEGASDDGLRAACVIASIAGRRVPPFMEHEL